MNVSTSILSDFYRLCEGRIPIIGVGGVSTGADAYSKIRAGASLVQLYTSFIFEGFGLANRINRDLALLLERDGFIKTEIDEDGDKCLVKLEKNQ